MPPISVMIKPASSACNLACRYCFYHSLAENRTVNCRGVMKTELFSEIMKKAFSFADGEAVTLSFQGGEPLLAKEYPPAFSKLALFILTESREAQP